MYSKDSIIRPGRLRLLGFEIQIVKVVYVIVTETFSKKSCLIETIE
jgi:hypothetical protein